MLVTLAALSPLLLTFFYVWLHVSKKRARLTGSQKLVLAVHHLVTLALSLFTAAFLHKYSITGGLLFARGAAVLIVFHLYLFLALQKVGPSTFSFKDVAPWPLALVFPVQYGVFYASIWFSDYPDLASEQLYVLGWVGLGCCVSVLLLALLVDQILKREGPPVMEWAYFVLVIPVIVFYQVGSTLYVSRLSRAGPGPSIEARVLSSSEAEDFYQGRVGDVRQTLIELSGTQDQEAPSPAQYFFLLPGSSTLLASTRVPTIQARMRELENGSQLSLHAVAELPGVYVTSPTSMPPVSWGDFFTRW